MNVLGLCNFVQGYKALFIPDLIKWQSKVRTLDPQFLSWKTMGISWKKAEETLSDDVFLNLTVENL